MTDTPLSAEERQRLESIHPMWSHQSGVRGHQPGEGCDVFPCLTNRALATIDAQAATIAELQREIEGYRLVVAKAAKVLASLDGCGNGRYGPICFRLTGGLCASCSVLVVAGVKVIASEKCARVLAGKEAQG